MGYLLIALAGLILSFFFSGAETAFVSVNKLKVEIWDRQKIRGAPLIKDFIAHPEKFLLTTLVGTNVANIVTVTFATIYFTQILQWNPETTWLVVSASVLFLGEIFPKHLFRTYADSFVKHLGVPLLLFYYLFYIAVVFMGSISRIILRFLGQKDSSMQEFYSHRDLEILLKESGQALEEKEDVDKIILKNLLNFKNVKVRDAMIPRTDIYAIEENSTIAELKRQFLRSGRTRIPVYRDKLDNIVGVVYVKDLFKKPKSIREILHPIMFVPEYKNAGDLLREFKEQSQSIAIVVDEYGGTAGLVTTEDLIEVLFGEIQDEFDEERKYIIKIDDKTYKVNARTEIEEFNEVVGASLPEGDYDTVGGFLLHRFGHIPKKDEELIYENLKFVVTKSTKKSIQWVRVYKEFQPLKD